MFNARQREGFDLTLLFILGLMLLVLSSGVASLIVLLILVSVAIRGFVFFLKRPKPLAS